MQIANCCCSDGLFIAALWSFIVVIAHHFAAAGQVAQKAADNFAGAGFGQGVGELDVAGAGDHIFQKWLVLLGIALQVTFVSR